MNGINSDMHKVVIMKFSEWFSENEQEHDLYNYPEEAMEAAYHAGAEAAAKILDDADKSAHPSDLADLILKSLTQ